MNIIRKEVSPHGIFVQALVTADEIRFDRTVGNGGPTAQNVEISGRRTIGKGPFLVQFSLAPEGSGSKVLAAGITILNHPELQWWTRFLPARLKRKFAKH